MCSASRDINVHLTMLIGQNGLEWCRLKLNYKLLISVTSKYCTLFTGAFGDIRVYISKAEIYAGQGKILLYTSQCFLAKIGSNKCSLELI